MSNNNPQKAEAVILIPDKIVFIKKTTIIPGTKRVI